MILYHRTTAEKSRHIGRRIALSSTEFSLNLRWPSTRCLRPAPPLACSDPRQLEELLFGNDRNSLPARNRKLLCSFSSAQDLRVNEALY
jgi:hypothetical protein